MTIARSKRADRRRNTTPRFRSTLTYMCFRFFARRLLSLVLTLGCACAPLLAQNGSAGDSAATRKAYEDRERNLLSLIKGRPSDSNLYNDLGVSQFYLGKGALAESSFQKAIQLNPENADARANLSYYYFQNGKEEAAADLLKQALQIDPDNFLANYFSGLLYFSRKQPTRAEIFLEKALKIQPDNLDAKLDLIKVKADQKQTAEAEADLDRLAADHPSDVRIRYARAVFFATQK